LLTDLSVRKDDSLDDGLGRMMGIGPYSNQNYYVQNAKDGPRTLILTQ